MWGSPYGQVFANTFNTVDSLPVLALLAIWNNPLYWNDIEAWNETP